MVRLCSLIAPKRASACCPKPDFSRPLPPAPTLHAVNVQERRGYIRTLEDVQKQVLAKDVALRRTRDTLTRSRKAHSQEVAGLKKQLAEARAQVETQHERRRQAEELVAGLRSREMDAKDRLSATQTQVCGAVCCLQGVAHTSTAVYTC